MNPWISDVFVMISFAWKYVRACFVLFRFAFLEWLEINLIPSPGLPRMSLLSFLMIGQTSSGRRVANSGAWNDGHGEGFAAFDDF